MTLSRIQRGTRPGLRWGLTPPAPLGTVFQELEQWLQPFGAAELNRGSIGTYYPVDLYETVDAIVLEMAVPGVAPDQIDISLEGRQLTIRGSANEVSETESSDRRYWMQGIARGEFSRSVTVPARVNSEAITAKVDQGVLTVIMPKAPEALARKINVDGGQRTVEAVEPSNG